MKFHKVEGDTDNVYFGLELEAAEMRKHKGNRYSPGYEEAIRPIAKKIVEPSGGVLRDTRDQGHLEINTEPGTFAYWMANQPMINRMLATLRANGFTSANHMNGMHVHISKTAFNESSIANLYKFLENNRDFTDNFSDRPDNHGYKRCSRLIHGNRYSANYHDEKGFVDVFRTANVARDFDAVAINRKGVPTVEFRIFGGTLSKVKFYANLQFVHSLWKFCSLKTKAEMTLDTYVRYVKENKSTYPHLYTDLVKKGYIKYGRKRIITKS